MLKQTWRVLLEAFFPSAVGDALSIRDAAHGDSTNQLLADGAAPGNISTGGTADTNGLTLVNGVVSAPVSSTTTSATAVNTTTNPTTTNHVTFAADDAVMNGNNDLDDREVAALRQDAFEQQAALSADSSDDNYDSEEEHEQARQFLSTFPEGELALTASKSLPERILIKDEPVVSWSADELLEATLKHLAEQGGMQLCCSLLLVLGVGRTLSGIEEAAQMDWFLTYAEQLEMWQLWTVRALVLRLCPLPDVNRLSQVSTTVYVSCATCNKPLAPGGTCSRCRRLTKCSLCHMPVRDLYVWCQVRRVLVRCRGVMSVANSWIRHVQGCGHGGHMDHIQQWFRQTTACPSGCGHLCGL